MEYYKKIKEGLREKRPGVFFNSITVFNSQIVFLRLNADIQTSHSHSNEQMGYVLSGELELSIGNDVFHCKPGDAYFIPADVLRGFRVLNNQPVEYIEVFSPIKEENLI
jgi:mannose-6-phosphate isomerase-like protein (cupin superfamily)